jgi:FlaA1/EpsC-like NDP-sugar epimerase
MPGANLPDATPDQPMPRSPAGPDPLAPRALRQRLSLRVLLLRLPRPAKQALAMLLDASLALFAVWLAFSLRLDDLHKPSGLQWRAYALAPLLLLPLLWLAGMYRAILRYTGLPFLYTLGKAVLAYTVVYFLALLWTGWPGVPRSVGVLQPLVLFLLLAGSRIVAREWFVKTPRSKRAARDLSRLLIYGAGSAGVQLADAIATSREFELLGFIDDNHKLHGLSVNGALVFAPGDLPRLAAPGGATDLVLALPSASRARRNEIIESLRDLPLHVRSMPGLSDLAHGRVALADLRELDLEDLLGRAPTPSSTSLPAQSLFGKVVLVTGAGGSIGSELCRQILRERPSRLVLVENSEYALYRVHQELLTLDSVVSQAAGASVAFEPLLADVRDAGRMRQICQAWRPHTLFHAAAYKHVPLVEGNPAEGIANNTLGTLWVAQAAQQAQVERFVLVSSDKAVRPTNVMGASKRFAELVLQALAAATESPGDRAARPAPRTIFSMVRFGNVLGSSGSVVPLFRRQIEAGGPVTVTHPEVTRYFMTIPEAAQLVLQVGAMAQGGEVFVLDMGQPVKIIDLARRMIGLSGLAVKDAARPDGDIAIEIIGLRPGEKLYEELLIGEDPQPTRHPRIWMAREAMVPWDELQSDLQAMRAAVDAHDPVALLALLRKRVQGYTAQVGDTDAGAARQPTA